MIVGSVFLFIAYGFVAVWEEIPRKTKKGLPEFVVGYVSSLRISLSVFRRKLRTCSVQLEYPTFFGLKLRNS